MKTMTSWYRRLPEPIQFWFLQTKSLIGIVWELWPGILFFAAYLLIAFLINPPHHELPASWYGKGILVWIGITWLFMLFSHVLRQGNRNRSAVGYAVAATVSFWLLGMPLLALILLTIFQAVPFFLGGNWQEQAEHLFPRLAILIGLIPLSVWIIAFG